MESKNIEKENLLLILKKLSSKWDLADGLYIIVEKTEQQEILNILLNIFSESLKNIKDKELQEGIQEGIDSLQKIRLKENTESNVDIIEADDLISNI